MKQLSAAACNFSVWRVSLGKKHFVYGIGYERYEKFVFETRSQITQ